MGHHNLINEFQNLLNLSLDEQVELALKGIFLSVYEKYGKEKGKEFLIKLFNEMKDSI